MQPPETGACVNCFTYVQCADNEAYAEDCQSYGDSFCSDEVEGFDDGVCYPGPFDLCQTCRTDQGIDRANNAKFDYTSTELRAAENGKPYKIDFYNPRFFWDCNSNRLLKCPLSEMFDESSQLCIPDHTGEPKHCTQIGRFAHPMYCNKFLICTETAVGLHEVVAECDAKSSFYEESGTCENACDEIYYFECEEEGRFADPFDCTKYHICISANGSFQDYVQSCPFDAHWSPLGRCVSNEESMCEPQKKPPCASKPEACD